MTQRNVSKKGYVDFLLKNKVLMFGNFTTKSGKVTPYFFNFGRVHTGDALAILAKYYAKAIIKEFSCKFKKISPITKKNNSLKVIFGPAYKGIPLAVAITIELQKKGIETAYSFNRKEKKQHGDKGILVGKELTSSDRVIIVDDVITSGSSIAESITLIREQYRAKVIGVMVAIDREESAEQFSNELPESSNSAIEILSSQYRVVVKSIIKISDLFEVANRHQLISKENYLRFKK